MNGKLWSAGIVVRVNSWEDGRVWAHLHFEDEGHAGHPPGVARGGIVGRISCRYGLGPVQPESVETGIRALVEDAKRLGIELCPRIYIDHDEDTDEEAARAAVTPIAAKLGLEIIK